MFSLRTIFVSIIALLLVACGTVRAGRDFDVGAFAAKIERGVTTQIQTRTLLGEPASIGVNVAADGETFDEWTYYYAFGKLPYMSDTKIKLIQIQFDKQGVVRSYNWSASVKNLP